MKAKHITKLAIIILLNAFIGVSIILLMPESHQGEPKVRAKSLKQIKVTDKDTERIDYVDENGNITIAADVGYATVLTIKKENSRIEYFYDERGKPIRRYSGYYSIFREYDEEGRNYHIRYLGIDDLPIITGYGYSDKYLTFYDTGRVKTEKYYDPSGKPVCTTTYGYGLLNEYDENEKLIRITYLNANDEPMLVGLGYAIVIRKYYATEGSNKGKIESEFYFDAQERPIALSLGQYGVHKEYDENGQEYIFTYLDQNGKPIITNKGYTTIKKTYHADGRTETERYYDIKGNPISLSEGQYGIKKENDQIVFLNKNGEETFNIKRLLYNQSWIIIPGTILFVILSVLLEKKHNAILGFFYIIVILYLTVFFRENNGTNPTDFLWHYKRIIIDKEARDDILKNIWLFIPLGTIMFKLYPKSNILLVLILFSIFIEVYQYLTGTGFCELDDIISNSIGGLIGFHIGQLTAGLLQRIKSRRHIYIE